MSFLDFWRRPPRAARIAPLGTEHAGRLAEIHASAFARAWGPFEFERLLADKAVLAKLDGYGIVPVGGSPEEFAAQIKREAEQTRELAKRVSLKAA